MVPGGGATTRPEGEHPPPGPSCARDSPHRPSGEPLIADALPRAARSYATVSVGLASVELLIRPLARGEDRSPRVGPHALQLTQIGSQLFYLLFVLSVNRRHLDT